MNGPFSGQFNQAGMLAPLTGAQSAALRRVRGPVPHILPYLQKYGGNLGMSVFPALLDVPHFLPTQYGGVLPGGQQPDVLIPDPWSDPARGAP